MVDISPKAIKPDAGKPTAAPDLEIAKVLRVTPTSELIRKYIKHPITRVGFPAEGGSCEWPNDRFTRNRIRDGDVTIEKATKAS